MTTHIYVPQSHLSSVVELFWIDQRDAYPLYAIERVLPNGVFQMILTAEKFAMDSFFGERGGRPKPEGSFLIDKRRENSVY